MKKAQCRRGRRQVGTTGDTGMACSGLCRAAGAENQGRQGLTQHSMVTGTFGFCNMCIYFLFLKQTYFKTNSNSLKRTTGQISITLAPRNKFRSRDSLREPGAHADRGCSNYVLQTKNWNLWLVSRTQIQKVNIGPPGLHEVMLVRENSPSSAQAKG